MIEQDEYLRIGPEAGSALRLATPKEVDMLFRY